MEIYKYIQFGKDLTCLNWSGGANFEQQYDFLHKCTRVNSVVCDFLHIFQEQIVLKIV